MLGKVLLIPKVVVNEDALLKFYSIYNVCKRIKVTLMYMELKCDWRREHLAIVILNDLEAIKPEVDKM